MLKFAEVLSIIRLSITLGNATALRMQKWSRKNDRASSAISGCHQYQRPQTCNIGDSCCKICEVYIENTKYVTSYIFYTKLHHSRKHHYTMHVVLEKLKLLSF